MFHRPKDSKNVIPIDVKTQQFWRYYFKKSTKPIAYSKGKDLYKEMFEKLCEKSLETGDHFYVPNLGFFGMVTIPKKVTNEKGDFKPSSIGIDWEASKKLWRETYPGKTNDELTLIKNKKLIRYKNKTKIGSIVKLCWYESHMKKRGYITPISRIMDMQGRRCREGSDGLMNILDFKSMIRMIKKRS